MDITFILAVNWYRRYEPTAHESQILSWQSREPRTGQFKIPQADLLVQKRVHIVRLPIRTDPERVR